MLLLALGQPSALQICALISQSSSAGLPAARYCAPPAGFRSTLRRRDGLQSCLPARSGLQPGCQGLLRPRWVPRAGSATQFLHNQARKAEVSAAYFAGAACKRKACFSDPAEPAWLAKCCPTNARATSHPPSQVVSHPHISVPGCRTGRQPQPGSRMLRCLPAGLHPAPATADALGCHQLGSGAADCGGERHQHMHDLGLCRAERAGRGGGDSRASSRRGSSDRDIGGG